MSRGIIEAQTLRTEQFEFEARTSDPADAQPGEYWFRVDQTSTNPDVIAELRRQDTSGVTTCPIFAASEESNLGTDVTRGPSVVLDDGSVGFIVMATGRGAVGSPRAVNSAGTQYVSHNALELSPIPDSVVSRETDDGTATDDDRDGGLVIQTKADWPSIGARLSANTTGATRAYLYRDDDPTDDSAITLIADIDISGLSSGDAFTFDNVDLPSGNEYWITLDAEGSTYDRGFFSASNYEYTTSDIDIIGRILDGSRSANVPTAVNDVGNVGFN